MPEPLLLLGAGAIGSLYLIAALSCHASVIVADVNEAALERARRLGAGRTINLSRQPLQNGLKQLGVAGVSLVVECTGSAKGLSEALAVAERGGRVVLVGLQSQAQLIDFHDLVTREISIQTTNAHVCQTNLPQALELLGAQNLVPLLVDRVVDLKDFVVEGLLPASRGETSGKVLVRISP